jgi:hypothetical protein
VRDSIRVARAAALLLFAPVLAPGARAQGSGGAVRPMLLHAAPDSGYVYLSWNLVPAAPSYQVDWRPRAAGSWHTLDVDSASYSTAVTGLDNDVAYEFRVRAGGGPDMRPFTSPIVVETPRIRDECTATNNFSCSAGRIEELLARSVTGPRFRCAGVAVTEIQPDSRNCAYSSGDQVLGFDRYVGRVFHADPPAPQSLVRAAARRAIWGDDDPFVAPDRFPHDVRALSAADLGLVEADSAASYIIRLTPELSSRYTIYSPRAPLPGQYVIYHEGHGQTANTSGADVINWFLTRGWTVVAMDMPLEGTNATDARYPFDSHDALRWYGVQPGHSLDVFLMPVKLVVDHVMELSPTPSPNIVLAGRSGGAWTACVYGALDPRITVMIDISGCWPHSIVMDSLALPNPNVLHFETLQPALFDQVSMLELITAAGTRGNFHFYSANDPSIRLRATDPYVLHLASIAERENAAPRTRNRTRVHVGTQPVHGLDARAFEQLELFLEDLHLPLFGVASATANARPAYRP